MKCKIYSSVSYGINSKRMVEISFMLNKNGVTASMHNITYGLQILIKPVSAAEDMLPSSFYYNQALGDISCSE